MSIQALITRLLYRIERRSAYPSLAVFPRTCSLGPVQEGVHLVASLQGRLCRGRWLPWRLTANNKNIKQRIHVNIDTKCVVRVLF